MKNLRPNCEPQSEEEHEFYNQVLESICARLGRDPTKLSQNFLLNVATWSQFTSDFLWTSSWLTTGYTKTSKGWRWIKVSQERKIVIQSVQPQVKLLNDRKDAHNIQILQDLNIFRWWRITLPRDPAAKLRMKVPLFWDSTIVCWNLHIQIHQAIGQRSLQDLSADSTSENYVVERKCQWTSRKMRYYRIADDWHNQVSHFPPDIPSNRVMTAWTVEDQQEEEIFFSKVLSKTIRFSPRPYWQAMCMYVQSNLTVTWDWKSSIHTKKSGRRRANRSRIRAVDGDFANAANNDTSSSRFDAYITENRETMIRRASEQTVIFQNGGDMD